MMRKGTLHSWYLVDASPLARIAYATVSELLPHLALERASP